MTLAIKKKQVAATDSVKQMRLASIDILRAMTMVLMIWVNDFWSLKEIPEWLKHTKADFDGMGFSDVIFPAFLFIVGMSLPFAVNNRRSKGDTNVQILFHVLLRSAALLIMGVFLVNGENINAQATGMPRVLWNTLCCLSFILIWNSYRSTANIWLVNGGKALAIVILLVLAFLFRGGSEGNLNGFSTYWWGILGLIGWAYLVSGTAYTFLGKHLVAMIAVWLAFIVLCMASHADLITLRFFKIILGPQGDGGLTALVLGGAVISMIYLHFRHQNAERKMLLIFLGIALVLQLAGMYLRPFWGISKIHATPSWILICSAITILAFVFIYWLADIWQKAHWFNFIRPAGTNTLLCYFIPYFVYAIMRASGIPLPEFMLIGAVGLVKSFLFALLCVYITSLLEKRGVHLKL